MLHEAGKPFLADAQAGILLFQPPLELPALHPAHLFSLPCYLFRFPEELDKPVDLGLQDDRHQGLHEIVHRAKLVGLFHVESVVVVRGEEDDGRVPRP